MINSLCGSMGSLKSELTRSDMSSCSKGQPTSPTASVSESNIVASSSDLDQNNHINPSANSFQGIKFEEVDVEVQSPDNSLWESLFADQIDLGTDFMISSPRRWDFMVSSPRRGDYMISSPKRGDLMMISSPKRGDWMISSPKRGEYMISSPKRSDYMISSPKRGEYVISSPKRGECWMISSPKRAPLLPHPNYTANNCGYVQGLHGQPNPLPTSYSTAHIGHSSKAKSSPLHKVYNSTDTFVHPDNYMLPPLDSLLDDYGRDNNYGSAAAYPPMTKMSGVGSSSESFDPPGGSVPGMYYVPQVTRPCESVSEMDLPANSLRVNLMRESYQMSSYETASSTLPHHASTSQQQQQQLQLLVQQQQHQETLEQGLAKVVPSECEQEQDSGLELVHLLLACAEAVAKEDYMLARKYLHHLNRVVSPLGDSMQRVAACFTEALSAKLTATITTSPTTSSNLSNSLEILKIYQILYQACPYIKFAHFTANQAIFEAFDLEERVHVIDLDILQGYQWPAFMQALAARPGGAPFLRITGVGSPLELVRETGRRLTELAQSLHVPFQFHPVGESLEDLQPHMFHRRVGEALAVNAVNRLHHVPGNCLGNLIGMIRDQAPNIVTLVEQEASHNGPYFLGRFLEALHYYSAIFDSLDATFPADSPERAKLEQYIFAPEIRNIVACEGAERKERHERLEKWRKIMEGKGFKGVPLSSNAVTQSKILLGLYPCDGYRLTEDKGCLLLGWQDRAIIAASAWRC